MSFKKLLSLALFILTTVQATAAIVDGVRQKPVPKFTNFATRSEVYLYNVGAQAFFTQGDAWNTKGIVGQTPRKIVFEDQSEGKYIFFCYCWRDAEQQGGYMAPNWRQVFIDSETAIFVDRNSQPNYFWDVALNGDGTFRILPSAANPTFTPSAYPGMYLGLDVTGNASNTILSPLLKLGEGHYVDWAMVSQDDFPAYVEALKIYDKAQELKRIIDGIKTQGGSVSSAEAVYLNESATIDELQDAIDEAKKKYAQLIIDNALDRDNVDVTMLLTNPDFEQGEMGWTVVAASGSGYNGHQGNVRPGGSSDNQCYEAWNNRQFDIYQVVEAAPVGVYEIAVQGFYRYGRDDTAWNAYLAQNVDYVKPEGVPVYVYMNNNATNFVNVFGDSQQITDESFYSSGSSDYASQVDANGTRYYFPNGMASAAIAFSANMYTQSAFGLVARDGDVMRLGVKGNSNQLNDSWVIWDNFRLLYRGFKADVIRPVLENEISKVNSTYIGLLMGKTEYAAFTTALSDAALAIEQNDGEGMFNALNALYEAKDPALISKDIFLEQEVAADTLRLAEAIRSMEGKKLSKATLANANALLAGIVGNTLYENEEIDQLKNDVTTAIEALSESVVFYEQLAQALDNLAEAIAYLETSFSQQEYTPDVLLAQAQQSLTEYTSLHEAGAINDADISSSIAAVNELAANLRDIVENYILPAEWSLLKTAWMQMDSGAGWKQNWNFDTDTPSSKYVHGVTATNGRVTAIDLSNNNLSGSFPYALLDLPNLGTLNVSYNNLDGDIGQGLKDYVDLYPESGKSLNILNIGSNKLYGNVGLLASLLPNLTNLDAGWNRFTEVYPMIDKNVSVNLRGQLFDCELNLDLNNESSAASIANQLPSIALYNHDAQTFGPNIRLHVYSDDYYYHMYMYLTGMDCVVSDGKLSLSGGNLDIDGIGNYLGESGDLLNADTGGRYETPWDCSLTARLVFNEGDGNFDGSVDILDLQSMILYIMEELGYRPYNYTASNLWADDHINIQDVICLVNLLLDVDQVADGTRNKVQSMRQDSEALLNIMDNQIQLTTVKPVAALDLYLSGTKNIDVDALERIGMTVVVKGRADGLHMIAYSMNGSCIPEGTSTIGIVDTSTASVKRIMLSDSRANALTVITGNSVTGIESLPTSEHGGQIFYDLQGRKVSPTCKGLYIVNGKIISK